MIVPTFIGSITSSITKKREPKDLRSVFEFSDSQTVTVTSISAALTNVTVVDDVCYSGNPSTTLDITATTNVGEYTRSLEGLGLWNCVVAPLEYKYISESDNMVIQLLGVIPLMLLIIPVMAAVSLFSRRD